VSGLFEARTAAIEQLRRDHAFRGAREGGIVLDGATGDLVEYVVGEEFSVVFDEEKLSKYDELIVFHSHPVDWPANQWDWQWLAEHANVREFLVVGPSVDFHLIKLPTWQPSEFWVVTPFDDWDSHIINIILERGFSIAAPPDEAQKLEIRIEANRRMARQFQMTFFEETP